MTTVKESFELLKVTDFDDIERGYVVARIGTEKLEDTNLWPELNEARDHVTEANNLALLRQFWPNPNEPEVQDLINDPDFSPLKYHEVEEIADYDELSDLVASGDVQLVLDEETGEHSIHPDDRHKVRTEKRTELIDPSQPMQRFHEACEAVATDRLEAARD
jgi:hypothetical protein